MSATSRPRLAGTDPDGIRRRRLALRACVLMLLAWVLPAVTAGAATATGTHLVDASHARLAFRWSLFGLFHAVAEFETFTAAVRFNHEAPAASRVEVEIRMASLATGSEARDHMLKGPRFFDVQAYPWARFEGESLEPQPGEGHYEVRGRLTLHGVTRPLALDLVLQSEPAAADTRRIGGLRFRATASLRRSAFGMGAYVPVVRDEVDLRISGRALARSDDSLAASRARGESGGRQRACRAPPPIGHEGMQSNEGNPS